jgi:hypothetical protein
MSRLFLGTYHKNGFLPYQSPKKGQTRLAFLRLFQTKWPLSTIAPKVYNYLRRYKYSNPDFFGTL